MLFSLAKGLLDRELRLNVGCHAEDEAGELGGRVERALTARTREKSRLQGAEHESAMRALRGVKREGMDPCCCV